MSPSKTKQTSLKAVAPIYRIVVILSVVLLHFLIVSAWKLIGSLIPYELHMNAYWTSKQASAGRRRSRRPRPRMSREFPTIYVFGRSRPPPCHPCPKNSQKLTSPSRPGSRRSRPKILEKRGPRTFRSCALYVQIRRTAVKILNQAYGIHVDGLKLRSWVKVYDPKGSND